MDQTTPANITISQAKSQVMRSILTPLCPIMEEATPNQTMMEDNIFFNITLPLLTHLRTSLMRIVSTAVMNFLYLLLTANGQHPGGLACTTWTGVSSRTGPL